MAVTTTIIEETALYRDLIEFDDVAQTTTHRREWKPGSPGANDATLRQRAETALAQNTTYLALTSPTNAQNAAQIQRLTRECNALIRLAVGLLDDISGT